MDIVLTERYAFFLLTSFIHCNEKFHSSSNTFTRTTNVYYFLADNMCISHEIGTDCPKKVRGEKNKSLSRGFKKNSIPFPSEFRRTYPRFLTKPYTITYCGFEDKPYPYPYYYHHLNNQVSLVFTSYIPAFETYPVLRTIYDLIQRYCQVIVRILYMYTGLRSKHKANLRPVKNGSFVRSCQNCQLVTVASVFFFP